jgi:tRNA/rRNA methyltransferase
MTPIIILVETQLAENLGAVARCMANFGLNQLRLVRPRVTPLDSQAISTAVGAADLLQNAEIFDDFEAAIADLKYVFATTACQRDMIKVYETPKSFVESLKQPAFQAESIGIIFGPERTGLLNDYIARCYRAITIPVNPNFPSLNLAQAVAIIGYEWFENFSEIKEKGQTLYVGSTHSASQRDLREFLSFFRTTS